MNAPISNVRDMRDATLADLHEHLGHKLAVGGKIARSYGADYDADATPLRDLEIDARVRKVRAPSIVDTPFTQTLRTDWQETERLMDEAFTRFRSHRNGARYKAECTAIVERGEAVPHVRSQAVSQWKAGAR